MTTDYVLRRAAQSVVLLFLVTVVVFLILQLVPGDPAVVMLGGQATLSEIELLRKQMGLDRPLVEQYLQYFAGVLRGDLGLSIRARIPVVEYITQRLPASLALATVAFSLVLVIGIPAGVVGAVKSGTLADHLVMTVAILGQAVPAFWIGLLMIILFAVRLRVLPPFGFGSPAHFIMPAITLALLQIGLVARVTRSEMLGVLSSDYIRTARAKGLLERRVIAKHALRNALIPLITVLGVQFGTLMGGAVVTETVFGWPGIGSLVVNAVYQRDYPVVQGVVLMLAVAFVMINFVVDSLYAILDPRVVYV